jgi:hypothetical protein
MNSGLFFEINEPFFAILSENLQRFVWSVSQEKNGYSVQYVDEEITKTFI